MAFTDTLLTLTIILLISFIVYTRTKNQSLADTLEEIKSMVKPKGV